MIIATKQKSTQSRGLFNAKKKKKSSVVVNVNIYIFTDVLTYFHFKINELFRRDDTRPTSKTHHSACNVSQSFLVESG